MNLFLNGKLGDCISSYEAKLSIDLNKDTNKKALLLCNIACCELGR